MSLRSSLLLCGALLLLLPSCKKPEPITLIPFTLGKEWRYRETAYDSAGQEVSTRELRTKILRDTMVHGERWFELADMAGDTVAASGSFATNRPDGVYLLASNGMTFKLYSFPARVGDTCAPYIVSAVDTPITSPGGTFRSNCYQNLSVTPTAAGDTIIVDTREFLASGFGLVRHETSLFLSAKGARPAILPRQRVVVEALGN